MSFPKVLERLDALEGSVLKRLEALEARIAPTQDKHTIQPETIYSTTELAELVGLSRQAIYNLVKAERVKTVPLGESRAIRIRGADWLSYAKQAG
jgi:predicted DNA-binding transcriptional regulator AlpA